MLPKYEQARKAIWDAVNPVTGKKRIDEAFPPEIRRKTNGVEMKIELWNGSVWQLVGSDNYDSYVGSQPVGVVFSEWALSNPLAWSLGIRPMLEQNGGWALWIYTPRGDNHGRTLYEFAKQEPGWYAELIGADKSPVFTREQLTRILREMTAELGDEQEAKSIWMQEYFCSFTAAIRGSYYSAQMAQAEADGRIGRVPHQPQAEVWTYWDMGQDDSTSIWFIQHIGTAHHVIDYYERSYAGMGHFAQILREKNYTYAGHVMPHDANVHEYGLGEVALSRKEQAEAVGIKPIEIRPRPQNWDLIRQVQIPAVRNILAQCWFDKEKCATGISALKSYHAEYDEEKKVIGLRAKHDWSSHAADAFRTFAVGFKNKTPDDQSVSDMMRRGFGRAGSIREG